MFEYKWTFRNVLSIEYFSDLTKVKCSRIYDDGIDSNLLF